MTEQFLIYALHLITSSSITCIEYMHAYEKYTQTEMIRVLAKTHWERRKLSVNDDSVLTFERTNLTVLEIADLNKCNIS